ncbi:glutathione S-transferase N-terminal domain-containing protein [Myxococcota bacterium]|nr:glutathione S-transferase N-terminal domain-containing protein [Myxococcota bacterium]
MAGGSQAAGQGSEGSGENGAGLVLYGYPECPYCRRVLAAIESLGLDVPLRNTMRDDEANDALVEATGRETVPVLRIEQRDGSVRWMPESLDIVRYLNERFGSAAKA